MSSRNKKLMLFQRSLIWFLYLFSIFITFAKVIYPLSIFWLQIRIKRSEKFLPIDSAMKTSQLWFNLLPVLASFITVVLIILNSIFYLIDKVI